MRARLFHLHALSALHCGVGQSVGVVDLPIARARATNLPIVPGSSLRGVLRQHVIGSNPAADRKLAARTLFGPEGIIGTQDAFASALAVGDAHLLVLPIRCLTGIVCHATSPFILRRYARDLARVGVAMPAALPREPAGNEAVVAPGSVNLVDGNGTGPGDRAGSSRKLVLEDLDLTAREDASLEGWAAHVARTVHPGDDESQSDVIRRFALLPDTIMDFLAETATEIRARIALDPDTGAVKGGALWYEENLPAESVLWGVFALSASNNPDDPRPEEALAGAMPASGTLLQLGGKAGVGLGLARFLTGHGREPSAVHEGGAGPEEATT